MGTVENEELRVAYRSKGTRRRRDIIEAAAAILREKGPAGVSHRTVAARAGCSLSATTYYFTGLDELLAEAGHINIEMWAQRAERVAGEISNQPRPKTMEDAVATILRACLPATDTLDTHYLQLVAATASAPVTTAYREGRARLDYAVSTVLDVAGTDLPADIVIAIVDGAAVAALSEGRDVRETARARLTEMLEREGWQPPEDGSLLEEAGEPTVGE